MEQEISGLKVCRQLLLLQTLIQIRPQVVIFTGLLQRCKQWGYQTVHGTNPVTYDLPIPFEEAPFTVAISTGNSGNHASCGGFTKTTIVLRAGTTAGVWDTVGFFIIGCQLQWGFTNNTGRPYITFPFKFSNVFTAISCICHNGSPSEANTVYNVSISGMNIGASGGGSGKYWCAFGVAQQQWRNNPGLWAIPFTEFVAGGITMTRTGSQSSGTWYGDSGTISLTGYTASCATNESWVSSISGSAIAVGL